MKRFGTAGFLAMSVIIPCSAAKAVTDFGTKYIVIMHDAQGHDGWDFIEKGFKENRVNASIAMASGQIIAEGGGGPFGGPVDLGKYKSNWSWMTTSRLALFRHSNVSDGGFSESGSFWSQRFYRHPAASSSASLEVSTSIEVLPYDLLGDAGDSRHRITAKFYYSAEATNPDLENSSFVPNAYLRVFCNGGPDFQQETNKNSEQQSLEVTYTFNPKSCKGPLMIHTYVSGSDILWRGVELSHKQL